MYIRHHSLHDWQVASAVCSLVSHSCSATLCSVLAVARSPSRLQIGVDTSRIQM